MRTFIAMRVLSITATLAVALHALKGVAAVAAPGTRLLSPSPTGSPDSSYAFQTSTQDTVSPSSQLTSEGSGALDGVKIAVVCLALLGLAWRIWGILKNTDAWQNLLVLFGEDPAAQLDEGPAAHGRLLVDGDPAAGLELALGPASTPAGTAGASTATETQLAVFTRECIWTSTSSSMSARESHYSQPTSARSA